MSNVHDTEAFDPWCSNVTKAFQSPFSDYTVELSRFRAALHEGLVLNRCGRDNPLDVLHNTASSSKTSYTSSSSPGVGGS